MTRPYRPGDSKILVIRVARREQRLSRHIKRNEIENVFIRRIPSVREMFTLRPSNLRKSIAVLRAIGHVQFRTQRFHYRDP